jgi:hypothetical protein
MPCLWDNYTSISHSLLSCACCYWREKYFTVTKANFIKSQPLYVISFRLTEKGGAKTSDNVEKIGFISENLAKTWEWIRILSMNIGCILLKRVEYIGFNSIPGFVLLCGGRTTPEQGWIYWVCNGGGARPTYPWQRCGACQDVANFNMKSI